LFDPALGRGDADLLEHFDDAGPRFGRRDILVQKNRLGDLIADRMHGREGGHRLLEDHAHQSAAHLVELFGVIAKLGNVDLPGPGRTEEDLSCDDFPRLLDEPKNGVAGDRFPTTRLPHERQGPPAPDRKRDAIHRRQHALVRKEMRLQPDDVENDVGT